MGTTVTAPASTKAAKDNSDIVSSTATDGRPGWQQAKDFLDSNWLLSMGSYMVPVLGTARTVDDAVGNFKAGNTLAGIGDLGLAALSAIPGVGAALGVAGKGAKGIKGLMGSIKGEKAATGAGGAAGLFREGSLLGRGAAESRAAEEAARGARATTEGSRLNKANKATVEASNALDDARVGLAREQADAARKNIGYEARNTQHMADENARLARDYDNAITNELIKLRTNPGNVTNAAGREAAYRGIADTKASRVMSLQDEAARIRTNLARNGLTNGAEPRTILTTTTGQGNAKKVAQSIDNRVVHGKDKWDLTKLSDQDRLAAATEITRLDQIEAELDALSKFDNSITRGTAKPLDMARVSDATRKGVSDAEDALVRAARERNAAREEASELERVYSEMRSIGDWDSLAEILSMITGGARTAAPWARGIIGQSISPLMYQSEQG